ncbi:putative N-acetylmannosamine-6-phosphate 2-epimerase [Microlunatus endophyticus]|uniref:Putative N-acetylmannosamine-6-phosphate 2-epimerase n=1 Tax=Microlunatus endophyticus TaxID=1716077 RepID=A0A917SF17_9ACTN|nr:N-acetylmannosamine-6-phosphate 2-epimerase [Microlunatus endophyticus]GGL74661.1 putative N-acetylmannosamine-6-phosphate 2-epimerase [Microlunatus endophyticus]
MINPLGRLEGGLIVSCQAYPGEPLFDPDVMRRMAEAAVAGGAVGIRAKGLDDIRLIRAAVDVPVIGLVKVGSEGVYITPTVDHAVAVAAAGAGIVAIDGTRRPRPDGLDLAEVIATIHDRTDALVMADVGDLEDGLASAAAGADLISSTLAGYTGARPRSEGPDVDLVRDLASAVEVPVLAEGRIRTAEQAGACLQAGAHAVVVGTAITYPTSITRWFVDALHEEI